MLSEDSLDELSIRKISKESGCTSATIYLHFKNFNHLLLLVGLKYLHDYVKELSFININFKTSKEEYLYI